MVQRYEEACIVQTGQTSLGTPWQTCLQVARLGRTAYSRQRNHLHSGGTQAPGMQACMKCWCQTRSSFIVTYAFCGSLSRYQHKYSCERLQ